jgi:phospholipid/cholesterol/gamma-HCH transport system substrate-binding protein
MKKQYSYYVEISVGIFLILSILGLCILVFNVSGTGFFNSEQTYDVTANFTNIGGLKVRSPVTIAGVKVGEVKAIKIDPNDFNATVTLALQSKIPIPYSDTSVRILTEGLLGANYISISPGFEDNPDHPYLRANDVIAKTEEALILENLIGKLLFNVKK